MAETLRELVVSLSLQSDSFSKNVKSLQKQIREIESRFDDAGDGADGFEAKLKNLGDKLTAQGSIVDQYKQALNNANTALGNAVAKNDDLKKKLDAAKTAHSNLKTEVENATAAYNSAKKAYGDNSDEAIELGLALLDLEEKEGEAAKSVKDLEGKVNASNISLQNHADKVTTATTNLNKAEKAYEATKSDIAGTQEAIKKLSEELGNAKWTAAQEGLESFGKKAQDVGKTISGVGKDMSLYITAPLAALGGFAYKSAADYEQAFVGVRKTTEATEEEFGALHEALLEMSERTPVGYADLARIMEVSGQLGVEGVGNLTKFTEVMAALGVSTNLDGEQAAESLAKFANITSMSLDDVDRLGSTIVALGNNYATTEADIVSMATRMASSGDLAGLSETDILALAAALSSVGIEAEAGGSAAGKLMKEMQIAAETGGTVFADVMGLSADDFAKAWDEDAAQTILAFFESLSKLDEGGQTSAIKMLDDMGLTEIRLSNLILASTKNTEGFASALEMANTAWEENTALMAEAEQFYDTELSKAQAMANRAQNVAADFGDNITEMLKPLKEQLLGVLEWFNSFDEDTQGKIITAFAIFAAGGPVVTAIGGTIEAVGDISTGIGKVIGAKDAIIAAISGPAGWATLAVVGVAALGFAIANIKSDMDVITERAAGIELKIDETSKNETLQAIAEVRKGIEELSGSETSEKGAGVIATVKAGYGTSEMYGQALAYASSEASAKITAAGADYQSQIDNLNAQIVAAVEAGDQLAADELAAQRDRTYSAWDAEVLAIKEAHTQSISELVDGMAAQYPEAKAEIADAMEQYSAFKALNEYDPSEMTDDEMQAAARKLLGMEGMEKALAEMGQTSESIIAMYGGLPVNIFDGLRTSLANSLATSTEATADSPIYTVLQSMLSDAGAIESLDFTMIDGSLADGIALLDFRAAAEQAQSKGGEIGQYLTSGLGTGISRNVSATNKDVLALRDAVVNQTRSAFDMGSPSRVMAREGEQIPAGLAQGIDRGAYKVKDAMVRMAREAVKAAKRELQIESPSRVMRDQVGVMIPRGAVAGIEEETARQQRVVQNAFRALVRPALAGAQGGTTTNSRTNHYSSTVSLAGAIINVRDQQDIRALALELNSLQIAEQRALGRVSR